MKIASAVVFVAILAACRAGATTTTPPAGTVTGRVTAGPTCPVERAGHPCPPRPVSATVEAKTLAGARAGSAHTDANGHFSIRLAAGTYTLTALTQQPLPRCAPRRVTVHRNAVTTAAIACDTGIR